MYIESMNGGDPCLGNYTDMRTCNERDCPGNEYFWNILKPVKIISCYITLHMVVNLSSRSRFSEICMSMEI